MASNKLDADALLKGRQASKATSGTRPTATTAGEEDIQDMIDERSALTDEALQSTRNALSKIHETQAVGEDTIMTLQSQGEQLTSTEQRMKEVDANAQLNYDKSKKVKKYGNLFNFSFTTFFNRKKKKVDMDYQDDLKAISRGEQDLRQQQRQRILDSDEEMRKKIAKDAPPQKKALLSAKEEKPVSSGKEQEMDENLNQISHVARSLTKMARDMGDELDEQNITLQKIEAEGRHVEGTLDRSVAKIEKYS